MNINEISFIISLHFLF